MDVLVVCSKINLASNSIGALEALDKGCKTIQCIRRAIGYFKECSLRGLVSGCASHIYAFVTNNPRSRA